MKVFLNIVLWIVVVGAAGGGGFLAYQTGYSSGEIDGHLKGYESGEEYGYETGSTAGYDLGYTAGETAGFDSGFSAGSEEGYDSGFTAGEEAGYQTGYTEGQAAGYETGVTDSIGHGYTLRDPTYAEALAFMRADKTDENEYVLNPDNTGYVCSHYARDTGNNAEAQGYRCAMIELRYRTGGHAIIAFNTVDRGMTYFETQSDEITVPVIGKRYYQCVIPKPNTYYEAPDEDDTIMDILIHW
jgi:hypothetical protein